MIRAGESLRDAAGEINPDSPLRKSAEAIMRAGDGDVGPLIERLRELALKLAEDPIAFGEVSCAAGLLEAAQKHWIVTYTNTDGDSIKEPFAKKREAAARHAQLKAGTYAKPGSITVEKGSILGRPERLSTQILEELVRRFVAARMESEELQSLTDRQRSGRAHREAAEYYGITNRYVRRLLEG
jgi:hypothetical protein